MTPRRQAGRRSSDSIAVALLVATLIVVTLLLGQALLTLRSHERMVEATLDDFAAFAAERVAAELNSTFSSIFLDQIALSRSAHYAWVADTEAPDELPSGRWYVPTPAIPTHFTIDEDELITRGEPVDAELEAWLLGEVLEHAREIYPEPAPYALLRSSGAYGTRAVAYRKEAAYEGVGIYGFLIRFDEFEPIYRRVVADAPTLPLSLSGEIEPAELMGIELLFPQSGERLYRRAGPEADELALGEAIAAKAGRLAVRVRLDAATARALVPGGNPGTSAPLFGALAALTLGLLAMSVALQRRASRLAEMRETFVANVSHDLRTPLAQIRMFSETLLLGRMKDGEERRRSLEIIHHQARNLSDLVANIVHAAGREGAAVRPTRTDLEALLADAAATLAPTAHAKEVTIETELEGDPEALVDSGALRRILINLVENAIKYGPTGQTVTVTLRSFGADVHVVVRDRGPGIPRRERARVWERFTRLHRNDDVTTGAGIGLAVVRDLAERHGGSVAIDDATGGGARVSVTLASDLAR